jgi:hypothetical protein
VHLDISVVSDEKSNIELPFACLRIGAWIQGSGSRLGTLCSRVFRWI